MPGAQNERALLIAGASENRYVVLASLSSLSFLRLHCLPDLGQLYEPVLW